MRVWIHLGGLGARDGLVRAWLAEVGGCLTSEVKRDLEQALFSIMRFVRIDSAYSRGTWCSGITSASHAEGPGFNPQCVQRFYIILVSSQHGTSL